MFGGEQARTPIWFESSSEGSGTFYVSLRFSDLSGAVTVSEETLKYDF